MPAVTAANGGGVYPTLEVAAEGAGSTEGYQRKLGSPCGVGVLIALAGASGSLGGSATPQFTRLRCFIARDMTTQYVTAPIQQSAAVPFQQSIVWHMKTDEKTLKRIYNMTFSSVYPHYVTKVEKKGRTREELDEVITWLTGFDDVEIRQHIAADTTFQDFFAGAQLNPNASLITGVICGVRVEEIEDPVVQQVRYLDKLVDELARGKAMEKILR